MKTLQLDMADTSTVKNRRTRWPQYLLTLITLLAFVEMAWLSIARYRGYNARAFDLGVMSQAVWSVTQGQPLIFTLQGVPISRLARHVELIYVALAPFYALFPTPVTLVLLQAALYAAGAVPVFLMARRRLDSPGAGVALAVIYLFYPVAQTSVLFDVHGDTLAMPLLLFALEALQRRAWRSYAVWLLLALSCKVYVAIPVTALGLILWLRGDRRVGQATFFTGVIWGTVAFWLIRPAFAPPEAARLHATASSYVEHYFGDLERVGQTALVRLVHGLIAWLPAFLLAWRAPLWLLPAAVIVIPVVLSDGPGPSYNYHFHHYALAVPFLIMALIEGIGHLRSKQSRTQQLSSRWPLAWRLQLASLVLIILLVNATFLDTPLNSRFYQATWGDSYGLSPSRFLVTGRDQWKDRWLEANIPADAAVAADLLIATHLVNRPIVYLTDFENQIRPLSALLPELSYVVVDTLPDQVDPDRMRFLQETISLLQDEPDFQLTVAQDGLLLFARSETGLRQQIEQFPAGVAPSVTANFDDRIGLIAADGGSLGSGRYWLQFDWIALQPLADVPLLVAVSRLEGPAGELSTPLRIVHLPTLALAPTTDWQTDEVIREQFEFTVPDDLAPGRYRLEVGWYDTSEPTFPLTDTTSRVGPAVFVLELDVPE